MLVEVQKGSTNYANRSKLAVCCKKIGFFAQAFAPYFDVIGIFVQIKPEWAGWFWGVLRLILQACATSTRKGQTLTSPF